MFLLEFLTAQQFWYLSCDFSKRKQLKDQRMRQDVEEYMILAVRWLNRLNCEGMPGSFYLYAYF